MLRCATTTATTASPPRAATTQSRAPTTRASWRTPSRACPPSLSSSTSTSDCRRHRHASRGSTPAADPPGDADTRPLLSHPAVASPCISLRPSHRTRALPSPQVKQKKCVSELRDYDRQMVEILSKRKDEESKIQDAMDLADDLAAQEQAGSATATAAPQHAAPAARHRGTAARSQHPAPGRPPPTSCACKLRDLQRPSLGAHGLTDPPAPCAGGRGVGSAPDGVCVRATIEPQQRRVASLHRVAGAVTGARRVLPSTFLIWMSLQVRHRSLQAGRGTQGGDLRAVAGTWLCILYRLCILYHPRAYIP
jgi:hypothetical protein